MLTRPHSPTGRSRPHNQRRVLALAASLRRDSHNRSLLEAAADLAPEGLSIDVYDGLGSIPLFDQDHEESRGALAGITHLRDAVARSDAMLIATPEYNQSIPGVLKNTIDWLARSSPGEGLSGLPVAITGATTGAWGTRLAQSELRHTLFATGALVLPTPGLYVRDAASVFDPTGNITDEATRHGLKALLGAFSEWINLVVLAPSRAAVG